MPSLIAYLQLGHETDCLGRLVNVDWSQGGAHPRSYTVGDINSYMCVISDAQPHSGACMVPSSPPCYAELYSAMTCALM
jgi:hypothetical protein